MEKKQSTGKSIKPKKAAKKPAKTAKTGKSKPRKKVSSKQSQQQAQYAALSALFDAYSENPNPALAEKKKIVTNIHGYLQEYMSNFVLIGYDMKDNPLVLTWAPTYKDMDAISVAVHRYVLETYQKNMPGGGS